MMLCSLGCVLLVLGLAHADKDDDFYPPGVTNRNSRRAMYWKHPRNVMQDLSQFSALYVKFHSCS